MRLFPAGVTGGVEEGAVLAPLEGTLPGVPGVLGAACSLDGFGVDAGDSRLLKRLRNLTESGSCAGGVGALGGGNGVVEAAGVCGVRGVGGPECTMLGFSSILWSSMGSGLKGKELNPTEGELRSGHVLCGK